MPQPTYPGLCKYRALIALGANVSDSFAGRVKLLRVVIDQISAAFAAPAESSQLYRTPAYPTGAGPDFVNAVIRVATDIPPQDVMTILHAIEADHGRERVTRWAARTLDLDLIGVDDLVLPDRDVWQHWHDLPAARQATDTPDRLILPHPRLQDRAFVLVPLCDVAPDWRHPVLGLTAAALCARLPIGARDQIVPVDEA